VFLWLEQIIHRASAPLLGNMRGQDSDQSFLFFNFKFAARSSSRCTYYPHPLGVFDLAGRDTRDHDGSANRIGWALLTLGTSGHFTSYPDWTLRPLQLP
jgi:hypothetical protein